MKTKLLYLLTFFAIFQIDAQVRIIEVNPTDNTVVLKNYGGTTDVTNFWFCSQISYGRIGTMTVDGNLNMANLDEITVTSSVNLASAADLGLYNTNSFNSTTAMEDFTQWGGSFDFPAGRENVAVDKGIWEDEMFITVAAPYEYTGNGSQNGVMFWDTLLSIETFEANSTFSVAPNPTSSVINIQFSGNLNKGTITLYNMLGKLVLTEELNGSQAALEVSNLAKGIYLLKVDSGKNSQTKRVVIQ